MTLETDKESISDLFVSSFEVFSYLRARREWERKRENRVRNRFSVSNVGKEMNCPTIPLYEKMKNYSNDSDLLSDGLHFGTRGNSILADFIEKFIKDNLKVKTQLPDWKDLSWILILFIMISLNAWIWLVHAVAFVWFTKSKMTFQGVKNHKLLLIENWIHLHP